MVTKTCTKCSAEKGLNQFYRAATKHGYRLECRVCTRKDQDAYQNSEYKKARQRTRWLWRMYQLTDEDFTRMAANGCAVCGTKDNLKVDHDHKCCDTGPKGDVPTCGNCVRGVLCSRHNLAEGKVKTFDEAYALATYKASSFNIFAIEEKGLLISEGDRA